MARLVLVKSPAGEIGIEYNDANLRATQVYSTFATVQVGLITLADGTFVRAEIDPSRPIPIPGNRRLVQTPDGLDLPGVDSLSFGAL